MDIMKAVKDPKNRKILIIAAVIVVALGSIYVYRHAHNRAAAAKTKSTQNATTKTKKPSKKNADTATEQSAAASDTSATQNGTATGTTGATAVQQ